MIALFRYILAVLPHSQRFLPPLMLFIGIAIMFVLTGDAEPVVGTYGAVTVRFSSVRRGSRSFWSPLSIPSAARSRR